MNSLTLTKEHREAILRIGNPTSDPIAIPDDILDDLLRLGILAKLPEGKIDFTLSGEAAYQRIARSQEARD